MNNQANFNWLSAAWRSQVTRSEQRSRFGYIESAFPLRKQVVRADYGRTHDDPDYTFCIKEYYNYVRILEWLIGNYNNLKPSSLVSELIGEGEEYAHLCNEIYNKFGVELSFVLDLTFEELAEVIYKSMKEL